MRLSPQKLLFIIRKFLKDTVPHTGKYSFKAYDSPTPLLPPVAFHPQWQHYSSNGKERDNTNLIKHEQQLVYITSPTQRSGTNFLNNVLKLHTDLFVPDEGHLPNEQFLYSFSHHLEAYATETVSLWGKWLNESQDVMDTHAKELMHYLGNGLLQYFYQYTPKEKTLLLKTPDAGNLHNFFHLFPQGKLIILVRDGRDTVDSFVKSWGGQTIFKKMCERWSQRIDQVNKVIDQANRSNKNNNYLLVRYEALNQDTSEQVKLMLKFLGLNSEKYQWDALEKIPVLGSSSFTGSQPGVHWKPMEKGDTFVPTEKWMHWSNEKKQIFKKYAGKNLIKMGFATDNDW